MNENKLKELSKSFIEYLQDKNKENEYKKLLNKVLHQ